MSAVRFVDCTLRDGPLSLWASSMTTAMMMPAAVLLDGAGFEAIELISDGQLGKAVRDLKDDPFERMRLIAARAPATPLRLIAGRINTFEEEPPEMFGLFLALCAKNGIAEVRLSDPWNEPEGWKRRVEAANDAGLKPVINLIYSISPMHTDAYYAERCRRAAVLPVHRICLKDPGGLLTPERTAALAPVVLANAGAVPVEFHTHCTTGLGPLCCLEAIEAGIEIVNTAIPPLSDGASNPSIFDVAANARALGHEPAVDLAALREVSAHFANVAAREGLPIGAPARYDAAQYRHQVPGGMISNLAHQLGMVGMADRLPETLEETVRVRAELGYPVMVTPLSQFVGSQAAINVVTGQRYRQVTDQVIAYALGYYGAEAIVAMDPEIRGRILDRPRAAELVRPDAPAPTLAEMRARHGGAGVTDEDMILRWLFGEDDVAAMKAAPPPAAYPTGRHPLVSLIDALARREDCDRIHVVKPGLSLTLAR